jgi:hypothetical protein
LIRISKNTTCPRFCAAFYALRSNPVNNIFNGSQSIKLMSYLALDLVGRRAYTRPPQQYCFSLEICQMAKLTTVYWRDIPAQVIAKERRETAKIVLTERFAEAIDKAAMRAKMAGTDAYLEEWRREVINCGRDLQASADEAAKKLEQDFNDDVLEVLVKNGGKAS